MRKIKVTEKRLARQENMLGKRLRTLYKEGKIFPVKILFSAEDYSDLLQKMKYMDLLMSHDSRIFKNYQKRWGQFQEEEKKLSHAKEKNDSTEKMPHSGKKMKSIVREVTSPGFLKK